MNRNTLGLGAIALASMLAGVGLYHLLVADKTASNPEPGSAPIELHAIPLTDLDERPGLMSDWQGDLLIVNFWAPWCAPCRREIPALIEIQQAYASQGVKVLGIAFDNKDQVRRFADDYRIDYPLFLADGRSAMYNAAFGNPSGALPFTALLDRDLNIIYRHSGEVSAQMLREQLQSAL